ncbi:Velvet factor [Penicillium manginii]|uniref:Velvet factor n=1 Tax=Penicillium manginii TaxID=203109 RepID=UPI002546AC73|nr:Velvet factor [Penicillium manginii]KAJ5755424.1 Velvet factor [Penicillium manginii]
MPSPVYSEKSPISYPASASITQEPKPPPRNPGYSMPHGFDKLLHLEPESSPPPPPRRTSTQSRYHLHVRQQPIAARACGAGDRDRRPVDPPPIVQILLTDFDPGSQDDRDILEDPRFTVGCLLFPVSDSPPYLPNTDEDETPEGGDGDGVARADDTFSTPLLSGKAFMSPFFVDADPDPNSAPTHPSSENPHRVPSPDLSQPENLRNASKLHQPATFFIFADLSIRSAGFYRLQFRLMNWGSVEDTGQSMPILAEAWSDPFRVYPAKDFPGMRDSSILAEGLKELGFVELKTRGEREREGEEEVVIWILDFGFWFFFIFSKSLLF